MTSAAATTLSPDHPRRARAIEILEALVGYDTTSRNSNLDLVAWVEAYLAQHDVRSVRIPDPDMPKASLFATIGPSDVGGVGLSGHTDVVPVDGQDWETDPFTLTARDGRLYGRGACDMKSFLACALAMVPEFANRRLNVPIHLMFSYDEEVGCTGVVPMIDELGGQLVAPRVVIVGEPTEMAVVDAHKGPYRWQVHLKGRAVHSSLADQGVNTITYAARLIAELDRIEQELKAKRDDRFDPPYTTLQVTQMEAGRASNIVPETCWFGWEIRALPGVDADGIEARVRACAETLEAEMKQTADEAEIRLVRTHFVPPFQANDARDALPLALRLAGTNETAAVAYATEASLFEGADHASIVCGPGNIAQAHTPNEWIEESEIGKCLSFMERLADWASASRESA
ncbi:MAG: acetylornithine deacetylase [Pseudomonadota bacterium]